MTIHGLLKELRTDNGPPFQSHKVAKYLKSWRIHHRRITPHWPQANGELERFMRTLNKVIRIAHANLQPYEWAIYTFLQEYRQTPHSITDQAPGHMLMGRVVHDSIPHHPDWTPTPVDRMRSLCQLQKSNGRISHRCKAMSSRFQVGDAVLLKHQNPGSKLQLPFQQSAWTILRITGAKVIVRRGRDEVSQNMSHVKKFHCLLPPPEEEEGAEHNCDPVDVTSPEGPSERVRPCLENEPSWRNLIQMKRRQLLK
ncbi:hypothetical protein NDU88_004976 [Pleurodeles waltl]|uniref:Integrase catalytic domain-containing protein n=1 Tax=Pleurodeles waltl TaxID=8319 RepID=A0AAV7RIW1_PLEWA|nr:hypothetical protein NDU88_004976 [Pleurodeles waltl]